MDAEDDEKILEFWAERKVLGTTSQHYEQLLQNQWVPWWTNKRPADAAISKVMSTIPDQAQRGTMIRGGDMEAFELRKVVTTIGACKETNNELSRSARAGIGSGKLQAGYPLIKELERMLWEPEGWDGKRLDERTTYVSLVMSYDGCYRGGKISENRGTAEQLFPCSVGCGEVKATAGGRAKTNSCELRSCFPIRLESI
jgi:hypothetical protein